MTPTPQCQHHRAVLSAVLDGVASPAETLAVQAHLAACPSCRQFQQRLERLDVLVAESVAPPTPDLLAGLRPVLADVAASPVTSNRDRPSLARYLLGSVGAAQILLGLPALLLGAGGGEIHLSRHLGAWAIAFGVGLVLAALRPSHARTLLPVAATLTAAVVVTTVLDVVSGHRTALPEAVHVLDVVGLALLAVVHRATPSPTRAGGSAATLPLAPGAG